jgi:hypothetical protein
LAAVDAGADSLRLNLFPGEGALSDEKSDSLRAAALFYHEHPKPGKLEIRATKPLANGRDLARAYSPGVAEASLEIKADPANAARYTARGNLVAVVSNGSAVLGLGNIGALASKPVMEGKAVLFKKFAEYRLFRPGGGRTRPREACRDRLRAGAVLRCDQSRRHQGARLFHR